MASTTWHLTAADGTTLGRLELAEGDDIFWSDYRFAPTPAFEHVAPLFADELALLNREEMEAWEVAYQRIVDLGLELRPEDGGDTIREFILHVDGSEARLRY
jgi:hypothetical protein